MTLYELIEIGDRLGFFWIFIPAVFYAGQFWSGVIDQVMEEWEARAARKRHERWMLLENEPDPFGDKSLP